MTTAITTNPPSPTVARINTLLDQYDKAVSREMHAYDVRAGQRLLAIQARENSRQAVLTEIARAMDVVDAAERNLAASQHLRLAMESDSSLINELIELSASQDAEDAALAAYREHSAVGAEGGDQG